MTGHKAIVKEQLIHMVLGTFVFIVLGGIAVALDLAAAGVKMLGVSSFTSGAIELTAHIMLVMDLVLFFLYIARTSWALSKEIFK
jgi:hypothetical protein